MWLIGNLGSFASGRGIHVLLTEWARQYGPIYTASLHDCPWCPSGLFDTLLFTASAKL